MMKLVYVLGLLMSLSTFAESECREEKQVLHTEFMPTDFDKGRSTVGADEFDPVKMKIQNFILSNSEFLITDILIHSSSSRAPFFISKSLLDPRSDERNLNLAQERAIFAAKALEEMKKSRSEFSQIHVEIKASLAGPTFEKMDLNTRFVTRMTPGYEQKIKSLFEQNKEVFQQEALIFKAESLMDEKRFVNFYQAKFKPFQGFKVSILGFKKNELKCSEINAVKIKKVPNAKGTRQ